jgi:two-component sensor histidine kinase
MGVDSLELHAGSAREVTSSRHRLEDQLRTWGCGDIATIGLVFAELASNAVLHADGASSISIEHRDGSTRLSVIDASPQPPRLRTQGDETGGFGLRIVDELATSWGWTHTATGKEVWVLVACCA